MLEGETGWPIVLPIGKLEAKQIVTELDAVLLHFQRWREVAVGEVVWEQAPYRATSEPVDVPRRWMLYDVEEWIKACNDHTIRKEFHTLSELLERTDRVFHSLLVKKISLWSNKKVDEVVQAAELAMTLEPGSAEGKTLRMLQLVDNDTKFIEKNLGLIGAFLLARYEGDLNKIELESFLKALPNKEGWLLVVDLDGGLLPFEKQQVRASELRDTPLAGERLLLVENKDCQHMVPKLPGTIAVYGSGFNLSWTKAPWLADKKVGYWGDVDTWGLTFLARARLAMPHIAALMMDADCYGRHQILPTQESEVASDMPPDGLLENERKLFAWLLEQSCGRWEQEFLPHEFVRETIESWARDDG